MQLLAARARGSITFDVSTLPDVAIRFLVAMKHDAITDALIQHGILMHQFIEQLDANPCDWETRLFYADWLEEQPGKLAWRAESQRWMANNQKAPLLCKGGRWAWGDGYCFPYRDEPRWTIPRPVFRSIEITRRQRTVTAPYAYDIRYHLQMFQSRQNAEHWLRQGLMATGLITDMHAVTS